MSQKDSTSNKLSMNHAPNPGIAYQEKPEQIEAFQMTEKRRYDNSEWPNWLHEAWNKNASEQGAFYPLGYGEDAIVLRTYIGAQIIQWGNYIIRNAMGELTVMSDLVFNTQYQRTK